MDRHLVFHTAEVVQERNVHRLIRDFEDEIPGYTNNFRICKELNEFPGFLTETGRISFVIFEPIYSFCKINGYIVETHGRASLQETIHEPVSAINNE